ncbi:hypothetical protein MTO96_038563 [Rhipicephalus appendiculatus]
MLPRNQPDSQGLTPRSPASQPDACERTLIPATAPLSFRTADSPATASDFSHSYKAFETSWPRAFSPWRPWSHNGSPPRPTSSRTSRPVLLHSSRLPLLLHDLHHQLNRCPQNVRLHSLWTTFQSPMGQKRALPLSFSKHVTEHA